MGFILRTEAGWSTKYPLDLPKVFKSYLCSCKLLLSKGKIPYILTLEFIFIQSSSFSGDFFSLKMALTIQPS